MSPSMEHQGRGTRLDALRQGSILVVLAMSMAFAVLVSNPAKGEGTTPTHAARRLPEGVYLIDGNRAGKAVRFPHDDHVEQVGEDACGACHHMNMPGDVASSCYECHRKTQHATDLFDHALHVDRHGGNGGCATCHQDPSLPKSRTNTPACLHCHPSMVASDDLIEAPAADALFLAPGYFDAMHGMCQGCHEMNECKTCHPPHAKGDR